MNKDYAIALQDARNEGSRARTSARITKNISLRDDYLKKAASFYEQAGDLSVQEANKKYEFLRVVEPALNSAYTDYRVALSIISKEKENEKEIKKEKERIQHKVSSVEKTINKLAGGKKDLEYRVPFFAVLSVISLIVALFFTTTSFTGYAISSLTSDDTRWIGLCLFVCGLIFTFLHLRSKGEE